MIQYTTIPNRAYKKCKDNTFPKVGLISKAFNLFSRDTRTINYPENFITDSIQAYEFCLEIKDIPEVRRHITSSWHAYRYCMTVRNDLKVRKYITDSADALSYCLNVVDSPEVRKYITDSLNAYQYVMNFNEKYLANKKTFPIEILQKINGCHAVLFCSKYGEDPIVIKKISSSRDSLYYCMHVNDIVSIRKQITSSVDALMYCYLVDDLASVRRHITESKHAVIYCSKIKDDPEIRKLIKNKDYHIYYQYKMELILKQLHFSPDSEQSINLRNTLDSNIAEFNKEKISPLSKFYYERDNNYIFEFERRNSLNEYKIMCDEIQMHFNGLNNFIEDARDSSRYADNVKNLLLSESTGSSYISESTDPW